MKRDKRTNSSEDERALNGKRHKQKRRGATARLYGMVLFFMLTIGVVLIFTVFFKVATIETIGLTRYGEEEVIASSGIEPGMNMFRLNRTGICDNLVKEFSYLKEVRLKFTLPDTVTLQVTEAEPAGALRQGESYLLFSEEGRVLETGAASLPKNIPLVKGFEGMPPLAAGQQMDYTDEVKLKALLESMAELQRKIAGSNAGEKVLAEKQAELDGYEKQADVITSELSGRLERLEVLNTFFQVRRETGLAGVTAIDITDPKNLVVNCGSKVELQFGTLSELSAKVKMAQRVLTQELGPDFEGRIDASFPGKAYVAQMDLTAKDMTEDEYAQYLYESASVPEPQSQSSAADNAQLTPAAPAAPAQQSQAEPETETGTETDVIAGEEISAGEEESDTASEDDFVAGVEE